MAGIQASGVGSGLDINTLVSQLVAAERAPLDARITRQRSAVNVEISGLSSLKSSMSTLKDALASIKDIASFAVRTATSSDKTIFTATADDSVGPGSYEIEVGNLATAQKLASGPFVAGRDAVVGTGTLTIAYGEDSFEVEIDSTHNTLAGIRDAINSAEGNEGVTASIINGTDGSRLVLTARKTGADNAVTITQAGGDGGLAALVYDAGNPGANTLTQTTAAADATIYVNGYEYRSASNEVTGAVDGLTISLLKADPGTTYTLDVGNDLTAVTTRIKKFVTDYNSLAKNLSGLQAYNATTGTAGPLIGNAYVRGVHQGVRMDISNPVSGVTGGYDTLASLGIKTDATGQLVVDDAKLTAALKANFEDVARLFGSDDCIAARLYTRLDAELKSTAQLSERTQTLNRKLTTLTDETSEVDRKMSIIETRYRAQFTALDTLLSQMQTTSAFLTAQLGI